MSTHKPVRGWLRDAIRVLGHVPVVTASEGEALRVVHIVQVDLAIVDFLGLSEAARARILISLQFLIANQTLPVICVAGPGSNFMLPEDGVRPHTEPRVILTWPISVASLGRTIAGLVLDQSDRPSVD